MRRTSERVDAEMPRRRSALDRWGESSLIRIATRDSRFSRIPSVRRPAAASPVIKPADPPPHPTAPSANHSLASSSHSCASSQVLLMEGRRSRKIAPTAHSVMAIVQAPSQTSIVRGRDRLRSRFRLKVSPRANACRSRWCSLISCANYCANSSVSFGLHKRKRNKQQFHSCACDRANRTRSN